MLWSKLDVQVRGGKLPLRKPVELALASNTAWPCRTLALLNPLL